MTFSIPWLNRPTSDDLPALEASLQRALVPVQPRAEFAGELRTAMQREARLLTPAKPSTKSLQILLISGASILGATLFILTGVRTVIAILGALGLYHQVKDQLKNPLPRPLRPAG